jgi:hypothetical protein
MKKATLAAAFNQTLIEETNERDGQAALKVFLGCSKRLTMIVRESIER